MVREELLETVKNRLINVYKPRALYLFGSYAWGHPDEQSDLDILVVVDESDEKQYKRPKKGIEALFGLGVSNDIIVFTKDEFDKLAANISTLCYKIKNEGVKLYEAA